MYENRGLARQAMLSLQFIRQLPQNSQSHGRGGSFEAALTKIEQLINGRTRFIDQRSSTNAKRPEFDTATKIPSDRLMNLALPPREAALQTLADVLGNASSH